MSPTIKTEPTVQSLEHYFSHYREKVIGYNQEFESPLDYRKSSMPTGPPAAGSTNL